MMRLLLVFSLLVVSTSRLSAAIVFDSGGFEAYALADVVGQFGWEDLGLGAGRFNVRDAITNGGTRAVTTGTSDPPGGFVAPRVNFTPAAGELVVIEVDISRTNRSLFPGGPTSPNFAVDVYNAMGSGQRILGFGLRLSATDQVEAFVSRFDGSSIGVEDLIPLPVAEVDANLGRSEFISFRAELNFDSDTFDLTTSGMNGTVNTGPLGFVNESTTLADADLAHESIAGTVDAGYYDNYRITTVPEPSSLSACLMVLAGLAHRRRRIT